MANRCARCFEIIPPELTPRRLDGANACERCFAKVQRQLAIPSAASSRTPTAPAPAAIAPAAQLRQAPIGPPGKREGSAFLCAAIGLGCWLVGAYFLVLEPSNPGATDLGSFIGQAPAAVVNLHRLTLGQTLIISGSVFVAAALRPR